MWQKIADAFHTRKQVWIIPAYGAVYLFFFNLIEKKISMPGSYHLIMCPLDKYIPFCEFFVVFYLSWFVYMFLAYGFNMVYNKSVDEFNRFFIFLSAGMTLFLVFSAIYPNGLNLRPAVMPRDNIFTRLVLLVYSKDTPTNVFPSIHCYNSVAIFLAAVECRQFKGHNWVKAICFIWTVLIILSTMFIKQHSFYDVTAGTGLAIANYIMIYQPYTRTSAVREKAQVWN